MFQGLFFSCSVFGSCPSNILKGSFCFCFLSVKYFQGILFFFVSCPSPIFSRDAFVLMFFLCDVFVSCPSHISTGCFCDFFLIRFLASQIFSRDAGVLLLPLLLLLQRLLLPLTTSATFVFSSFKWNLIFWILIGGGICKSSFWSE